MQHEHVCCPHALLWAIGALIGIGQLLLGDSELSTARWPASTPRRVPIRMQPRVCFARLPAWIKTPPLPGTSRR